MATEKSGENGTDGESHAPSASASAHAGVNTSSPSGGRGRRFKSSHPDHCLLKVSESRPLSVSALFAADHILVTITKTKAMRNSSLLPTKKWFKGCSLASPYVLHPHTMSSLSFYIMMVVIT